MEFPTSEIVGLIYQLMPGFLAAWIFHGFTAHPPKKSLERIVQALILTGIVKAMVYPIRSVLLWIGSSGCTLGTWTAETDYGVAYLLAILLGIALAACANNNFPHRIFANDEWDWVTKRTTFPSEWFSAFNRVKRYVTLHLKNKKRLNGWTTEWPDSSDKGHFIIEDPAWLDEQNVPIPLPHTEYFLIAAKDVRSAEIHKDVQKTDKPPPKLFQFVRLFVRLEWRKALILLLTRPEPIPVSSMTAMPDPTPVQPVAAAPQIEALVNPKQAAAEPDATAPETQRKILVVLLEIRDNLAKQGIARPPTRKRAAPKRKKPNDDGAQG